jgi:predicted component of type VI protein secretion system
MRIIETFETRLSELQDTMLPLHKQTSSLTRAQKSDLRFLCVFEGFAEFH